MLGVGLDAPRGGRRRGRGSRSRPPGCRIRRCRDSSGRAGRRWPRADLQRRGRGRLEHPADAAGHSETSFSSLWRVILRCSSAASFSSRSGSLSRRARTAASRSSMRRREDGRPTYAGTARYRHGAPLRSAASWVELPPRNSKVDCVPKASANSAARGSTRVCGIQHSVAIFERAALPCGWPTWRRRSRWRSSARASSEGKLRVQALQSEQLAVDAQAGDAAAIREDIGSDAR